MTTSIINDFDAIKKRVEEIQVAEGKVESKQDCAAHPDSAQQAQQAVSRVVGTWRGLTGKGSSAANLPSADDFCGLKKREGTWMTIVEGGGYSWRIMVPKLREEDIVGELCPQRSRPDLSTVEKRNAFYNSYQYQNMTTAEKCWVQGDGFINDYD